MAVIPNNGNESDIRSSDSENENEVAVIMAYETRADERFEKLEEDVLSLN